MSDKPASPVTHQFTVVAHASNSFETEEEALAWATERANTCKGVRFTVCRTVVAVKVSRFGALHVFRSEDDAPADDKGSA